MDTRVLVIAEHDNNNIAPDTLKALNAASQLGGAVSVLVIGHQCSSVTDTLIGAAGVSQVYQIDDERYQNPLAETLTPAVFGLAKDHSHVLAAATTFGKNLLPRVAALLDVGQVSDVISIVSPNTFIRPIYAGNALAKVQSNDSKIVMTVRGSAFQACAVSQDSAPVVNLDATETVNTTSEFIGIEQTVSERPDLSSANVVISGGRGLASKENFALVERLADKLGGAIGASRAAVDAGYVSNDLQVGQTGKIVAPDLYIAIGISGAIQHMAGMKDSKVIVAINSDPDAPIFEVADYGLVGDLFEIMPELIDKVP
ncbi:electron transfer flavoprotein subunit alpha/FixB family protein [Vibrio maritimus]|uniref:electron transfer flavoprotein subunit alpha/FixB family protein n=1 Tax=Vibrio maritimus TaxID=990268 RepID=UPI001F2243B3|nr:FAD-binding protein [Vibrio maritimus]